MRNNTIKTVILFLLLIFVCEATQAQSPHKMSYQAIIRTSNNELLRSSIIKTRISILFGSERGNTVYSESQTKKTDYNGLLSLKIGEGDVLVGDIEKIKWGDGSYYIRTETDPKGGDNYSIVSYSELMSVPYALYALNGGKGETGLQGIQGLKGDVGATGLTGQKGDKGETGLQGIQGLKGDIGATGLTGEKGDKGETGLQGIQGPKGDIGATGLTGEKGDKGETGLQGIQGLKGDRGESYDPSDLDKKVDKVKNASLINDDEIQRLSTLQNYIHPVNHPASIIIQDPNNRFVTDAEKIIWNTNPGGLKTIDGLELTVNSKIITDHLGNNSPLKMSLKSITNNGPGNIDSNTMFGDGAGYSNTIGQQLLFFGSYSGFSNTTGYGNTFIGQNSGYSNTRGTNNLFIGPYSGFNNTVGFDNIYIGNGSGRSNTTGGQNVFLGQNSGYSNTTGGQNMFLGPNSGYANTTGFGNTYLGLQSGEKGNSVYHNVFVGYAAGDTNVTGNKIVILGAMGQPYSTSDINEIVIGSYVKGKGSNTVTIGDESINNTYLSGTVSAPQFKVTTLNTAPSSSTDKGEAGELRMTSQGIYLCIAINSWIKMTGTTF